MCQVVEATIRMTMLTCPCITLSQADCLSNSWNSGGAADHTSLRAISAQAELQTDGGGGGGGSRGNWGNVFARKSELLGASSTDTPPSRHDSPRQAWWTQAGGGGGGGEQSADGDAAEGIAHISELLLYHDAEGAPELLGRGGFGQVSFAVSDHHHAFCSCHVIRQSGIRSLATRSDLHLLECQ